MVPDLPGESLRRYSPWFYAAAIYNLIWGAAMILFPGAYFNLVNIDPPNYLAIWQVVGMFVLVFAPAYWWVARDPWRHRHLVLIGLTGKVLGPIGFVWAVTLDEIPASFGWTLLTNDLIWWIPFTLFLRDAARLSGGWIPMLRGD
jgi:hypothetical protein